MTLTATHFLVLRAIQHVSPDRLQRAVCSLADGSITVTLTRHSETEIRALVKNGDGGGYGITLTEALTTCSCKDALYRGVICKHAVAVALHVLRAPQPKEQPAKPYTHLMWRDGTVLCGASHPERYWVWPWTDSMVTWLEACTACVTAYQQLRTALAAAA